MLNRDRIRLMTKLAAYEQGEGKTETSMGKYRRKDYVLLEMIRSFFFGTAAFAILFFLIVLYDMDAWVSSLYQMEYLPYLIRVVLEYAVFVGLYEWITWLVCRARYRKGRKNQKQYLARLKKVEKLYEREEKITPIEEWED